MAESFPGGRFSFKWWGKTHTGSSHRRRSVNFWLWLLPSLISCHSETTWLWIPHWDGLGPEGPPANLQVALLHRNSCSLHLPAQLCTYLSEVCATSFVMTEMSLMKPNANQCLFFWLNDEGFHGRSREMFYREDVGWIKYDKLHNVQLSLLMQKYCCGHFPLVQLNTVVL